MNVQRKSAVFKESDPVFILSLLQNFNTEYGLNETYKKAANWLFQHFMIDPTKAALAHRVGATENVDPQKVGKLTANCQVVDQLPDTYEKDNVLAEREAEIPNLKQHKYMSAFRHSKVLWKKVLLCGCVYEETCLKIGFIVGLHESVRISMRAYCAAY